MAILVAGAFVARQAGGSIGIAILLVAAAGAGGVDLHSRRRYHQRSALLASDQPVCGPDDIAGLTAMVLALSGAALVAILHA